MKNVLKTLPTFRAYRRFVIRIGTEINLWNDYWLHKPLKQILIDRLLENNHHKIVSSIIHTNANNLSKDHQNPFLIPQDLINELKAYPLLQAPNPIPDKLICNLTKNGSFNMKSIWNFIIKEKETSDFDSNNPIKKNYKWILKLNCHPWEQLFRWQTYLKGLPTIKKLHRIKCLQSPAY